jgi:hypothetical protein
MKDEKKIRSKKENGIVIITEFKSYQCTFLVSHDRDQIPTELIPEEPTHCVSISIELLIFGIKVNCIGY